MKYLKKYESLNTQIHDELFPFFQDLVDNNDIFQKSVVNTFYDKTIDIKEEGWESRWRNVGDEKYVYFLYICKKIANISIRHRDTVGLEEIFKSSYPKLYEEMIESLKHLYEITKLRYIVDYKVSGGSFDRNHYILVGITILS
jgi:hypothetical protein